MTSQVEPQVEPQAELQAEAPVKSLSVKEIVALLSAQFPLCFSLSGEAKPLKIGIFQDLVERLKEQPLLSKTQLRQALRVYTSSWRYLDGVKEGAARIDLDGVAGAQVDAQQAEHAAKTLSESKSKAAEIRKSRIAEQKAKQQQQRAEAAAAAGVDAPVAKPDKPAYKKSVTKPGTKPAKSSTLKGQRQPVAQAVPVVEKVEKVEKALQAVIAAELVVGAKVLVKLGQNPMPATVVEVVKQDVVVQLASGMVVKTHCGSLYQA